MKDRFRSLELEVRHDGAPHRPCPRCRNLIPVGSETCPECGERLIDPAERASRFVGLAAAAVTAPTRHPTPPVTAARGLRCPSCGHLNATAADECEACHLVFAKARREAPPASTAADTPQSWLEAPSSIAVAGWGAGTVAAVIGAIAVAGTRSAIAIAVALLAVLYCAAQLVSALGSTWWSTRVRRGGIVLKRRVLRAGEPLEVGLMVEPWRATSGVTVDLELIRLERTLASKGRQGALRRVFREHRRVMDSGDLRPGRLTHLRATFNPPRDATSVADQFGEGWRVRATLRAGLLVHTVEEAVVFH
jgi:predicted nucleic acid-binding Zn ribbon protein